MWSASWDEKLICPERLPFHVTAPVFGASVDSVSLFMHSDCLPAARLLCCLHRMAE